MTWLIVCRRFVYISFHRVHTIPVFPLMLNLKKKHSEITSGDFNVHLTHMLRNILTSNTPSLDRRGIFFMQNHYANTLRVFKSSEAVSVV